MFISDFTKMTSVTTGTGALTLAAASAPYVEIGTSLSAAWGTGTYEVAYIILENSTGKWERGIGSYVTSTKVLTRTLVSASFDASTLDFTAPANINFASGAVDVYISDSINTNPLVIPGTGNISSALGASNVFGVGMIWPYPASGGSPAVTANEEYYGPMLWGGAHQIDQVTFRSNSATTGNMKAAIYELKQSGLPGAKIKDITTGTAVGGSATNTTIAVTGLNLPPGWYAYGCIFDAAITPGVGCHMLCGSPFGMSSTGFNVAAYHRAGSYASGMPDPAGTSSPTAFTQGAPNTSNSMIYLSFRQAA